MTATTVFHKVQTVTEMTPFCLHVVFEDGREKMYDLKQLSDRPEFALLFRHPAFVKNVRIEPGGYAVSWNEQTDLSCEELWLGGEEIR